MRRRITISRGLLLTVPRDDVDYFNSIENVRVGYTVQWYIKQDFTISAGHAYQPVALRSPYSGVITRIHDGHVDIRFTIGHAVYVRYRC